MYDVSVCVVCVISWYLYKHASFHFANVEEKFRLAYPGTRVFAFLWNPYNFSFFFLFGRYILAPLSLLWFCSFYQNAQNSWGADNFYLPLSHILCHRPFIAFVLPWTSRCVHWLDVRARARGKRDWMLSSALKNIYFCMFCPICGRRRCSARPCYYVIQITSCPFTRFVCICNFISASARSQWKRAAILVEWISWSNFLYAVHRSFGALVRQCWGIFLDVYLFAFISLYFRFAHSIVQRSR